MLGTLQEDFLVFTPSLYSKFTSICCRKYSLFFLAIIKSNIEPLYKPIFYKLFLLTAAFEG